MFSDQLAERIENEMNRRGVRFEEKRMFGGIAFMVDGKMCVGVNKNSMMVRLDPQIHETALAKKGAREMDFTKRPMRGYVFVDESGLETDAELAEWMGLALEFNPRAKSSKRKS